jgi:hypothetical protein
VSLTVVQYKSHFENLMKAKLQILMPIDAKNFGILHSSGQWTYCSQLPESERQEYCTTNELNLKILRKENAKYCKNKTLFSTKNNEF